MSLIKWAPFLNQFNDMDQIFSEFTPTRHMQGGFIPAVDVYEDKNNVIVETELAGINYEKINISIENDVLCIKGESEKKSEIDDKNYYRKEIKRGSFFRNIPLPTHVLGDKASAEAIDGVLKILIPKASKAKQKRIKIKTINKLK